MASVSSTGSIYSSIVASNKGIGGLASGLDTEALMETMTAGTRAKIAREQQNQQLAQWKQTSYRSVVTAMDAFRQKYLRFGSGKENTNIASSSFFNSYKATSSNSAVKVTTTANSTLGDIEIEEVLSLATTNTITGNENGKQILSGDVSLSTLLSGSPDFSDQILSLTVDGTTKNLKLDSLNGLTTSEDFKNGLQTLINNAFGTKTGGNIVDVKVDGGQLVLSNDTGAVSIAKDNDLLGFKTGDSNRIDTRTTKLRDVASLKDKLVGDAFKVNINGVNFSFSGNDTIETIMTKVSSSTANVRMTYSSITGNFEIASKVSGHANRVEMSDVQGNFLNTVFGSAGGASISSGGFYTSDPIGATSGSTLLADYNSHKATEADRTKFIGTLNSLNFNMTIGNTTATVTYSMSNAVRGKIAAGEDLTAEELLDGYNRGIKEAFGEDAAAGIAFTITGSTVSLSTTDTKKVSFTHGSSGADGLPYLGYLTGDPLTNAVSVGNQTSVAGGTYSHGSDYAADTVYAFDLTVNGTTKNISYKLTDADANALESYTTAAEQAAYLAQKVNNSIYQAFGEDIAAVSGSSVTALVGFSADSSGKMSLFVSNGATVSLGEQTAAGETNLLSVFGFADDVSNLPTDLASTPTLGKFGVGSGELTINGETVSYDDTMTLGDLFSAINTAGETGGFTARFVDGGLVIDGDDSLTISETVTTGAGTGFLEKMYGIAPGETYQSAAAADYGTRSKGGTNAEIRVNGQIISSNSNTFTINGTELEVLATTTAPTKVTVTSEPDDLITKIKDFIADYNGLVSTITAIVKEKADEDNEYLPLSDEQKAEMTTEEIEKWEIEAKKGILRNDSTLNGILSQMRGILYEGVGDSGISLYSIGITSVSVLYGSDKSGHLEITAENEEKLRQAIIDNPDGVRELFTKAETGYAAKLDAAIDRAINTSSDPAKRGSLITLAGTTTLTANNSSTLDRKIANYDDKITRLKTQLENEYNRYWKQFTALEKAISNMNTQSSWLSSFVAG